jgi:type 2 lantibiotic biosynthesis protein LanM
MDHFFERFAIRAATIDELLSDAYEVLPGQKSASDIAARRLGAWCRSSASGDWTLFSQRLAKDGISFEQILPRFAVVRRNPNIPLPSWGSDAAWIERALVTPASDKFMELLQTQREPLAFEHLLAPIAESAQRFLWSGLPKNAARNFAKSALGSLYHDLTKQLSELVAPALYDSISSSRTADNHRFGACADFPKDIPSLQYNAFVVKMRHNGFRSLFESKPVLLRLIASVTRQWIDATREFITRLNADLVDVRHALLERESGSLISRISSGLGDRHNFGRSVQLVQFDDSYRILYKPRDSRLDALWSALIQRLNNSNPPCSLQTARAMARDGYGWSEFIDYAECPDWEAVKRFFHRAGAWLCIFHIFGASDMHEENMIASAEQPVPIDLETLLQPTELADESSVVERHAFELAGRKIADSVIDTSFLPAYGRSPENAIIAHGGLHNQEREAKRITWERINTDLMEPVQKWQRRGDFRNIPGCNGEKAKLGDFIEPLVAGYTAYAAFMAQYRQTPEGQSLFDSFAGVRIRRLLRPTRFYSLLLERLKDHRNMNDGVEWSAHLDFMTRLMDWDKPRDPWWPLLKAERASLAELNIPYFTSPSDGNEIADMNGISTHTVGQPGLFRAQSRYERLDQEEIAWQCEIVRVSTSNVARVETVHGALQSDTVDKDVDSGSAVDSAVFIEWAADIVSHLSRLAIRSGPGAAWIGLDWLGDSSICQLSPLGPDLYNGAPGICVFLAAYARLTGNDAAAELAVAGMSALRQNLRSVNAARFARALGLGGSTGLGSVLYALAVLGSLLNKSEFLDDAIQAATLFSDDLIAADKAFDVMEGSAGAILGLLKVYRLTGNREVLQRAANCADNLLRKRHPKPEDTKTYLGWSVGRELNGMSHGAAGFALAFTALSVATGRDEFIRVAKECIEFENASFSCSRGNWPDFRREIFETETFWPCQWCHGAGGIGLGRVGMLKQLQLNIREHLTEATGNDFNNLLLNDIRRSVHCAEQAWPYPCDTLCCGNLGNIELLYEAAHYMSGQQHPKLRDEALRRISAINMAAHSRGDYRWDVGDKRFNLGLFRGLAGVGYTLLRRVGRELPNLLIWE